MLKGRWRRLRKADGVVPWRDFTVVEVAHHGKRGRPRQGQPPKAFLTYRIEGALMSRPEPRRLRLQRKSCFILATSELNPEALCDEALLAPYKGQQQVERGFRFLKDPLVLASALYLKSPKRIMALMRVMTLCLLVYAALEYRLRQALKAHRQTLPNQKGKPIQNPSLRWVFQLFVGIHLPLIQRGPGPCA